MNRNFPFVLIVFVLSLTRVRFSLARSRLSILGSMRELLRRLNLRPNGFPSLSGKRDAVGRAISGISYLIFACSSRLGSLLSLIIQSGPKPEMPLLKTTMAAALCSLIIETMQFFLPERHPTASDFLMNTAGGFRWCLARSSGNPIVFLGSFRRHRDQGTSSSQEPHQASGELRHWVWLSQMPPWYWWGGTRDAVRRSSSESIRSRPTLPRSLSKRTFLCRTMCGSWQRPFDRSLNMWMCSSITPAHASIPMEQPSEGFERTFATNHLGHFLLTSLLLEPLREALSARIITVSSAAHRAANVDGIWSYQGARI